MLQATSVGARPGYREAAEQFGRVLAKQDIGLVYGGGAVGLMGVLADAALGAGGTVTGVIPQALVDAEVAHYGLTELRVVTSMHERKAEMASRADAFAVLPGGIGSLVEAFVKPAHRGILVSDPDPQQLLDKLMNAEVPVVSKLADTSQT